MNIFQWFHQQPSRLDRIEAALERTENLADTNTQGIAALRNAIAEERVEREAGEDLLHLDMSGLSQDMQGLRNAIAKLTTTVDSLRADVTHLWGRQGGPD